MVAAKKPTDSKTKVRLDIERYTPPAVEITAEEFITAILGYFDRYDMVGFYMSEFNLEVTDDDEVNVKII